MMMINVSITQQRVMKIKSEGEDEESNPDCTEPQTHNHRKKKNLAPYCLLLLNCTYTQ